VRFLLPYSTGRRDAALAAVIRSGSRDLVEFMLEHGADAGAPAHWRETNLPGEPGCLTNPLAEAICSQDEDLLCEMENLKALSHLGGKGHFAAAVTTAGEAGACDYMQKLLY
jgi:hypothetical protein